MYTSSLSMLCFYFSRTGIRGPCPFLFAYGLSQSYVGEKNNIFIPGVLKILLFATLHIHSMKIDFMCLCFTFFSLQYCT